MPDPLVQRSCLAHIRGLPKDPGGRAALLTTRKWNKNDLRVHFLEGDPDLQQRVLKVAKTWCEFTSIRFFRDASVDSEIRIAFAPGGSWSYIGTEATDPALAGQPTMNFGWLTPDTDDDEVRRVVLHEFGHALGLIHEHQHPKAGIPWNREKVYAAYAGPPNFWSRQDVDVNLFQAYSTDDTQFSEVDPHSIMMYPVDPALTDGVYSVGMNRELSETDKTFIATRYPR